MGGSRTATPPRTSLRSSETRAPSARCCLQGLVAAGELTPEEAAALLGTGLPPSQYTYVLMEWVGLHAMSGISDGTLRGGNGFEDNLLRRLTELRAQYFNIGDYAAGRMPLAYVQLVQVLVDSLVFLSPFALYPALGLRDRPPHPLLQGAARAVQVLPRPVWQRGLPRPKHTRRRTRLGAHFRVG